MVRLGRWLFHRCLLVGKANRRRDHPSRRASRTTLSPVVQLLDFKAQVDKN